mmetsp:Transcript_8576/g.37820  ORF Transcript_8576/g.37820 Transcript_8576/m.37820 type:complete len:99 (-) Transcript_8576:129-425(-)
MGPKALCATDDARDCMFRSTDPSRDAAETRARWPSRETFDVHWLDTTRSKLKHGKGLIENMGDIGKEETEGCAGSAGFSRSRAGVHREHGLVLQPRGV